MVIFIIALIVGVIGLLIALIGLVKPAPDPDDQRYRRNDDNIPRGVLIGAGIAAVLVALVAITIDSFTIVPTRSVGVQVAFGKPATEPLKNGLHWVAPWSSVEKFDASVQTLNLTAAKDDAGDSVTVRLGNQTTAKVDVSVQWNIDPDGDVVELYKRYRSFDNVENNLVKRQLQHALNIAFADYDPLRAINGTNDAPTQSVDDLAAKTKADLQKAVGTGIQIGTLTIPIIHFDGATEDRLRQYQQALADTRIAQQQKQTSQARADSNGILAASASIKDPGVQYQNCLDLVRDLAVKGQLKDLPATFNCGGSGQSPVIVGQR